MLVLLLVIVTVTADLRSALGRREQMSGRRRRKLNTFYRRAIAPVRMFGVGDVRRGKMTGACGSGVRV